MAGGVWNRVWLFTYKSLFQKIQTELTTPLWKDVLKCDFAFQDLDRFPVDIVLEQSLTVDFQELFIYNTKSTVQRQITCV